MWFDAVHFLVLPVRLLRLLIVPVALTFASADVLAQAAAPAASAPVGMEAVRARIRQIRGEAPPPPAPVIVVVPVVMPASGGGRDGRDGDDGRDGRNAPTLPLGPPPAATPPGVIYAPRRPPGAPVDPAVASPDAPARETPVAPPDRAADPVRIVEVERALLETGLFRALGVNFAFDRAALLDGAERVLDPVGDVLRRYPELRVEIGGHTDALGSDAYNRRLSERRAETVRRYLVEQWGIAPGRLTAAGYGESRPFSDDAGETGRALNRRVEFAVTGR